jgi:hypothetical protein
VVFSCGPDPKWAAATLQTITHHHRNLQQITIDTAHTLCALDLGIVDSVEFVCENGEIMYQGWLEIDHVLSQLRKSHPVRLKVWYDPPFVVDGTRARGYIRNLLPEVTTEGIVDLIQGDYPW